LSISVLCGVVVVSGCMWCGRRVGQPHRLRCVEVWAGSWSLVALLAVAAGAELLAARMF